MSDTSQIKEIPHLVLILLYPRLKAVSNVVINSIDIWNKFKAYKNQNKSICFILKSFNDCKIYPILEEVINLDNVKAREKYNE